MGLRKWRKLERPILFPHDATQRLAWARRYEHYTPEDWKRIFWSDECTVERGIGERKEWTFVRPKDQLMAKEVQVAPAKGKQVKQMFWDAFSGLPRSTGLIPLFV